MARIDNLLEEYGESHQHPLNKTIHWICVPAIVISLLGLIWSIPVPALFEAVRIGGVSLNWAILLILPALGYYFSLSVKLAAGMLFVIAAMMLAGYLIATLIPLPLWVSGLIIFSLAWAGQFYGHKIEGKKPSFMKDVQFLLIGPVWLLSFIYRKAGIRYS